MQSPSTASGRRSGIAVDRIVTRAKGLSETARQTDAHKYTARMPGAATRRADRIVRVGGLDLRVLDEGDGAPVLLLHGFPDRAEMWRHVGARLRAAGRRTIAPDLRGFGESSAPPDRRAYRVDHVIDDLIGLLDTLGIDQPVDIMGHDWGAFTSWAFCLAHPERVHRHVALSVGHPTAYLFAGLEQKRKGTYMIHGRSPVSASTRWPSTTSADSARSRPAGTPTSTRPSPTCPGRVA